MCGINGFVKKNSLDINEQKLILSQMNDQIYHRGPDEEGIFYDENEQYNLGMVMRRLSIIDLSTGQQPIYTEDKTKVIVFNGEIYNYKLLKGILESDGVVFHTHSDTEVILKLYEKYGVDSFSMLDGMFAFSIFDKKINKVFIARDYFGEKPLYYFKQGSNFYWASELKSIIKILDAKPEISKIGLNLYFQLTYIPAPYTIYSSISKLEANHYLEFDCNDFEFQIQEIERKRVITNEKYSKKEVIKKNHDLIQESVESRSVSDVSVGTFLSGGVDSSIVSLCLSQQSNRKIDTFSIGFKKRQFDESEKARTVSKIIKSNHHEFIIDDKDLLQDIHNIVLNFDEPFADSSALPTYLVANKTRKFVKVALTGDGGDEAYGGYNKYYMGKLNKTYVELIPKTFHSAILNSTEKLLFDKDDKRGMIFKANKFLKSINYEGDFYYNIISLGFLKNELTEIFKPDYFDPKSLNYFKEKFGKNPSNLNDFRNIDRVLSLEGDLLVKVDRATMLSSLESRAPFLNKKIWDFTEALPENYLIKGWDKKHLLKESFKHYFPQDFLNKPKKGFGVPVGDWLRGALKQELLSYVEKTFINQQGLFSYDIISKMVKMHVEGKQDNTFRIWTFYCFQKWYVNVNFGKI